MVGSLTPPSRNGGRCTLCALSHSLDFSLISSLGSHHLNKYKDLQRNYFSEYFQWNNWKSLHEIKRKTLNIILHKHIFSFYLLFLWTISTVRKLTSAVFFFFQIISNAEAYSEPTYLKWSFSVNSSTIFAKSSILDVRLDSDSAMREIKLRDNAKRCRKKMNKVF